MKTIFISYNLALTEKVQAVLDKSNARGFTRWDVTYGRGLRHTHMACDECLYSYCC